MPLDELAALGTEALLLSVAVVLPVILIAGVVSLIVAVLQAATQVSDATIAHLPRFLAVTLALVLLAPWMGAQIVSFATRAFEMG